MLLLFVFGTNGFAQIVVTNPSSPWTVPAGVTSITVYVWGGGGGGGGTVADGSTANANGGSGGGGAISTAVLTVSPTQTYTITSSLGTGVGYLNSGGTAGAAGNNNGTAGGTITFTGLGGTVSAAGGGGGGGNGNATNGSGAAGTAGNSGTGFLYAGGAGKIGDGGGSSCSTGGGGGGSTSAGTVGDWCAGGGGGTGAYPGGNGGGNATSCASHTTDNAGGAGTAPGGGGGGGYSWTAQEGGGSGGAGQVIIVYSCTPYAGLYTVGPTGSFLTLSAAAAALHNCGVSGPVQLQLQSTYLSSGEPSFPITFLSIAGTSVTNTVTIYESVGGLSITSAQASPNGTLDLSGCQYVIFDGRVNASGGTEDLVISNTGTGYPIQFINDASYNTIQYCKVSGTATSNTIGVIDFSTGVAIGNSYNTIFNCDISATGVGEYGIYSVGSAGFPNTTNVVKNCTIHDFFSAGQAVAYGVYLSTGSTNWTIQGNSIFETASYASAVWDYGIYINNTTNGTGFTINYNQIGGSSANCGGTWTMSTAGIVNQVCGIYLNAELGSTVTNIQGNIINNFSIASKPSANGTYVFQGIETSSGSVNIGTTANNIIGSNTAVGGITVTYGSPTKYSFFMGINLMNTSASDIVNVGSATNGNFLGGFYPSGTAAGAGTNAGVYFYGISYGSTNNATNYVITNNQMGNGAVNCMLNAATVTTYEAGIVDETVTSGTGNITISNNYVGNFDNPSVNQNSITYGILTSYNSNTITGNTIANMTSEGNGTYSTPLGISQGSTSANQTISGNQVYNLSNALAGATTVFNYGITYSGAAAGTNVITGNYIYNLTAASTSTSTQLIGFIMEAGTGTISNNMITLGNGVANGNLIDGIWDYSTSATNYYFNSIYLGGTTIVGASSTYAFYSTGTNARISKNNIYDNARSGAGIKHYAIYVSQKSNLTSNYNDLYSVSGYVGHVNATDYTTLALWAAVALAGDGNSISSDPNYISPTTATPDLDLNTGSPCIATGITGTGVLVDIHGTTRGTGAPEPCIGADEVVCPPPTPSGIAASPSTICNGNSTTLTASANGFIIYWYSGSCGTPPAAGVGTGTSLVVSPVSTTTYYACAYSPSGGCHSAACANVTVTVDPYSGTPTSITTVPASGIICSGSSATLTLNGGGGGTGEVIHWYSGSCGGTAVNTGNGIVVSPTVTTTYYGRYEDPAPCSYNSPCQSVTITVDNTSSNPASITPATTICNGSSTTLTLYGGGGGTGAVLTWWTGSCGGAVAGTGNNFVVSPGATTTYYGGYVDACGHTTTCQSEVVTVDAISGNPTGASASANPICPGGSTNLTLTGGGGGTGAIVNWYTGSCGGTVVGTGSPLSVSPGTTTTYYGGYVDACGHVTTCQAVTVTVTTATAQIGVLNSGAFIYITAGTFFYIAGANGNYWNYANCSGSSHAYINNSGTVEVFGSWNNNDAGSNVFTTNAGTTSFLGTAQTINGTTSTYFNNLTLNNTSTTLNVNTTAGGGFAAPAGTLTLTNGALILNSNTLTVTNPLTTAIGRTNGYIESETYNNGSSTAAAAPVNTCTSLVQWNIGTAGAGNTFIIPFGTVGGTYIPFSAAITTAGTGSGDLLVSTYHTSALNYPYPGSPYSVANMHN